MEEIAGLPVGIERVVVCQSGNTKNYILVGREGRYFQISANAYALLQQVQGGESYATIAEKLSDVQGKSIAPEDVEQAYNRMMEQINHLVNSKRKRRSFWLKFTLIPSSVVQAVASRLVFMFAPLTICLFLISFIAIGVPMFLPGMEPRIRVVSMTPLTGMIVLYSMFIFSLVIHEFGHATACTRGGVAPSDIGVTIYLVFPAFYSNVNASWLLGRWQRFRVDIGGIYFQLWIGMFYALLFFLTRIFIFRFAFFVVIISCLFSLNPFLKYDGYWMLTDLLGVVNLSRQPLVVFSYLCRFILRQPREPLKWSPFLSTILLVYGIVRMVVIITFLMAIIPLLRETLWSYSLLISTLKQLSSHNTLRLLASAEQAGLSSVFLGLWVVGLGRRILFLFRKRQTRKDDEATKDRITHTQNKSLDLSLHSVQTSD